MVKPNIIKKTPISMAQMDDELKKIKERDKELNFRANKTEQYLTSFERMGEKRNDLAKKIRVLGIPRLKEECVIKIIDLLPKTQDDLKNIFQTYKITVAQDNVKKILGLVKEI